MIATTQVRVYNASYEELSPTTLDSAMKLVLVQGRAEVVEYDESKIIRTMGGLEFFVPKIIRLFKMVKVPFYFAEEYFSKTGVLRRDNFTCGYCGITAAQGATLTHDHIMPKSRGGADSWENAITACVKCNGKKSNMTPEEAGMRLLWYPWTPKRMYFRSETNRRKRKKNQ
jgi:hypothetical protein